MTALQVTCPDIECDGCANSIKRSLSKLEGIGNVDVNVEAKAVTAQFDETALSEATLRERLTLAGFPPQN